MTVVGTRSEAMEPQRSREGSLSHVVETLLDKGLVINADIMVSVAGVELLGIRIRAALASFETAARYGLDFPAGTDYDTDAWREAMEPKETCPECGKRADLKELMDAFCPWCGWQSARSARLHRGESVELLEDDPDQEPDDEDDHAEPDGVEDDDLEADDVEADEQPPRQRRTTRRPAPARAASTR